MWRFNNMLLNNQQSKKKSKKNQKYLDTDEKDNLQKLMGCSKSSSKGDVHRNSSLHQSMRMLSNKQPVLCGKEVENKTTNKAPN